MRGTSLVAAGLVAALFGGRAPAQANRPAAPTILERFLALDSAAPAQHRALRHFDAGSRRLKSIAWMDVWTEADDRGFRYQIVAEGGSEYIRSRVFRGTLQIEERQWASNAPDRAAVTHENYRFADSSEQPDGLVRIAVEPRRKDLLLVDGWIFLRPADGDLVRIEGQLSKSPSFWTRGVHIVRHYERIGGVRMPVALETTSNVLIAGTSTFKQRWEYESVNGARIGTPIPRSASGAGNRDSGFDRDTPRYP